MDKLVSLGVFRFPWFHSQKQHLHIMLYFLNRQNRQNQTNTQEIFSTSTANKWYFAS